MLLVIVLIIIHLPYMVMILFKLDTLVIHEILIAIIIIIICS